jgi:hypothetical protein
MTLYLTPFSNASYSADFERDGKSGCFLLLSLAISNSRAAKVRLRGLGRAEWVSWACGGFKEEGLLGLAFSWGI